MCVCWRSQLILPCVAVLATYDLSCVELFLVLVYTLPPCPPLSPVGKMFQTGGQRNKKDMLTSGWEEAPFPSFISLSDHDHTSFQSQKVYCKIKKGSLRKIHSSQNFGSSLPKMTRWSTPVAVIVTRQMTPPLEPSRFMARAIATEGFKLQRGRENGLASDIVSLPSCPYAYDHFQTSEPISQRCIFSGGQPTLKKKKSSHNVHDLNTPAMIDFQL